jgi:alpha-L-fucosidase
MTILNNTLTTVILLTTIASASPLDFSNVQKIEPTDSQDTIVAKAAHVIPTPRQVAYLKNGFIGFIHFGPNTFTGREWGNGMEDPKIFAPQVADTDNWVKNMKAAGITMVVMTFKHHDGYVLWQSRYENHQTIKNSPYQNGKGDIAKQLSRSCKKYGLKFGVYLSPADLYQIESKDGLYGNGSKYQKSVIPTDPKSFKTNPMQLRSDKPKDAPTFTYECDDYNRYMLNQLYEMLTEYGPVHEIWFDGAHPKRKGNQHYTYKAWFELVHKLAPNAVIFGKGPDVRWCGNEGGKTRPSEWNVIPLQNDPSENSWNDNTPQDLGSRAKLKNAKFLYYRPAETNTSIRSGWFWRNDTEQGVRSADDVFDIYERAVGGNSVFMLNVPPNKKGVFSPRDTACLIETGKRIRATYGTDLAQGATISSPNLQDKNIDTFWQPNANTGAITITFKQPTTLNRFLIQEAVAKQGERIEKHALDAWVNGTWKELTTSTNVGFKRILRFPTVTTTKLRLRILESRLNPTVAEISVHFYQQPPLPVTASQNKNGKVILKLKAPVFHGKGGGLKPSGLTIHYTTDGSTPTVNSPLYQTPITLPNGGTIKACSFNDTGKPGTATTFRFGPKKDDWKASASNEHGKDFSATMAIDGNPNTFWHTSWNNPIPKHPHTLTIDLAKLQKITGITYLPRQDKHVPDSMIEQGRIEVSTNGKTWRNAGTFTFGNLLNDPTQRTFIFKKPAQARYIRMISIKGAQGKPFAGAAEFGILTD